MKKNRGFTLIELLAVIVILAIVALIAFPIINGLIVEAKKNSFKASASRILKAAEYYLYSSETDGYIELGIGKNDDVQIKFKGTRPDSGQVFKDKNSHVSLYMYSEKMNACVVKNYHTNDIHLYEDVTESACKRVIERPALLSDVVKIGDYVNYDTGSWSQSKPYAEITNFGDFGGYQQGMSRNQGLACENSAVVVDGAYGWRVIDIDKTTGTVSLIHAGTPECYRNEWGRNAESINILNNHDYSMYVNNTFATSATIFTKEMAEKVYENNISSGVGFYNLEHNVLKSQSHYWFPTPEGTNNLLYVQPGGYVGGAGSYVYGIRPVVKLKSNIIVTEGDGSTSSKYKIATDFIAESAEINQGLITGYWENWNGTSNLKLADVPYSYDIVALSFGITEEGSSKGTVDFSLDQYLSEHLGNYSEQDLKDDIKVLQMRQKKVILSIGGSGGIIIVDDQQSKDNFVNSVTNLIKKYSLNGIDVNIENGINPTYLSNALIEISNKFGSDFVLTLAPQTIDFKVNSSGQVSGSYYELISQISDLITIVNLQLYNSDAQYGLDGIPYNPGTVDFITSLTTVLIENGLDQSKVGIGTNYNSTKIGYMEPENIINAYESLKSGGQTIGGSYLIPNAYPNLGGFMVWSINGDYSLGRKFSKAYSIALK